MKRQRAAGWLTLGGIVAGAGVTLAVAFLIYVMEQNKTFWGWPGYVAMALIAVGLAMTAVGFRQGEEAPAQSQRGGANSFNQQAGRDIRMTFNERDDSGDTPP